MSRRFVIRFFESLFRSEHQQPRAYRVAPWLLVGPALTAAGYTELKERGLTHILDLRAEETSQVDVAPAGVLWRRVPVRDTAAPTFEQFEQISQWVAPALNAEGVVYVHCQGGLGRAPTISIALMMAAGFGLRDAFQLVLAARPGAAPTEPQRQWLQTLAQTLPAPEPFRPTGTPGSPPRGNTAGE